MMFLLAPLLIGIISYYTITDILAFRKRKRRVTIKERIDADWEAAAAHWEAAFEAWDKR